MLDQNISPYGIIFSESNDLPLEVPWLSIGTIMYHRPILIKKADWICLLHADLRLSALKVLFIVQVQVQLLL